MKKIVFKVSIAAFSLCGACVALGSQKQQSAHAHGYAEMNLVLEAKILHLEFRIPAEDALGFEHKPKTEVEKKKWERLTQNLAKSENFFTFSGKASCQMTSHSLPSDPWKENGDHHHHDKKKAHKNDEKGHESEHRDLRAEYNFSCENPENLQEVSILLFKRFSSLKEIKAQYVRDGKQGQKSLTPPVSVLPLPQ